MVFDIVGSSHSAITECDLACVCGLVNITQQLHIITYYALLCITVRVVYVVGDYSHL